MFVGHFAVGLAAKRMAPAVSLGTWFLAVQWVDHRGFYRDSWALALIAGGVLSHWVLDAIVHCPDLPLQGQRLKFEG